MTAAFTASAVWPDRACSPRETVERLRPHLAAFGITRLGKQTGLDRLGIPSYAAFRPNGAMLSVNQGKGLTDDAARASAAMEALEYAVAERMIVPMKRTSVDDLMAEGVDMFHPRRLLAAGARASDVTTGWTKGEHVVTGRQVLVPTAAVNIGMDEPELPGIAQTTNGLASGNTRDEAIFHAVCELVERDATTLHSIVAGRRSLRRFDPADLRDDRVLGLAHQIETAGCRLGLFDQTTDLAIPTVMAVIHDPQGGGYFANAAGYGCHPSAAIATIRAITEAAQTRITNIAGARDDIVPGDYVRTVAFDAALFEQPECLAPPRDTFPPAASTVELLRQTLLWLQQHGVADIVAVDLDAHPTECAVVKVFSEVLEDRDANPNWRPGARGIRALRMAA